MDGVDRLVNAITRLVAAQVGLKLCPHNDKMWSAMAASAESAAEELRTALTDEEMQAVWLAMHQAAPEQPPRLKSTPYGPAILLDDVRDAERYRWLRHSVSAICALSADVFEDTKMVVRSPKWLDEKIDAAIQQEADRAPKVST